MSYCAVISLGSNVDSGQHLPWVMTQLSQLSTGDIQLAHWYITRPWGQIHQPYFINGAVGLKISHTPKALLTQLQQWEQYCQRQRTLVNGPRTLDLDILWFDGQTINLPDLQIPHPGLYHRDFMWQPFVDIMQRWGYDCPQRPNGQYAQQIVAHYANLPQVVDAWHGINQRSNLHG